MAIRSGEPLIACAARRAKARGDAGTAGRIGLCERQGGTAPITSLP
jgi:hypothetical protein